MNTVVVTGSSSGLGLATKELLESDGVRVIGVDLDGAGVIADENPAPIARWAQPPDIAEAVYVVGSALIVDGGIDAAARPDSY
jgi:3alpha-hydroxysteroid 3-dehydrogenase